MPAYTGFGQKPPQTLWASSRGYESILLCIKLFLGTEFFNHCCIVKLHKRVVDSFCLNSYGIVRHVELDFPAVFVEPQGHSKAFEAMVPLAIRKSQMIHVVRAWPSPPMLASSWPLMTPCVSNVCTVTFATV